jgi:pyruvate/2-oxoglutarate dehydrogenase complex dihydrolipoamide dehydrogenase (E3) component
MFRRFGAEVTVVEQGPRLAAREDEDVAEALTRILVEDGIGVLAATRVERVSRDGDAIVVSTGDGGSEGGPGSLAASHLLVAVGRTPNTEALDLAAAGIETDERGYIRVDERLETNVPGVWALGDVNGGPPFTHVAYDDFRVVRDNLLGGDGRTTRDRMVPYVVFTDPELGRVGLGESAAREQGLDVKVARLPMTSVARAIETAETRGLLKAVVDARSGRILGAAALGVAGGEIVSVIQTAMMGGLPYTALRDGVFAHPTLAESLNNLFASLE